MKWRSDHSSCDCDLSNHKVSLENVFRASTGFQPMASALALQWYNNWAMKTHTLWAGQFIEFVLPVKGMKHTNEMKKWSSQLWLRFKQSQSNSEKCFRGLNGASTGSCWSPENIFQAYFAIAYIAITTAMITSSFHSCVRSSHNIHLFHFFHGYDEFNKLACSQRMGLRTSDGGALQH